MRLKLLTSDQVKRSKKRSLQKGRGEKLFYMSTQEKKETRIDCYKWLIDCERDWIWNEVSIFFSLFSIFQNGLIQLMMIRVFCWLLMPLVPLLSLFSETIKPTELKRVYGHFEQNWTYHVSWHSWQGRGPVL